jgi:deazaflavin-dependent oxidoreductase (nitroreductase family)
MKELLETRHFMSDQSGKNTQTIADLLANLAKEDYCYLTTTGRITGNPHEIEIWFGVQNSSIYMLSGGGKSDWVKNLLKNPAVIVRIANHTFTGTARIVKNEQEEIMMRNMLADKYKEREADGSLSEWAFTALPVAIDLKEGE